LVCTNYTKEIAQKTQKCIALHAQKFAKNTFEQKILSFRGNPNK